MLFKPVKPEKVRAEQLYEAQRLLLEHAAAAEHHQALADMYAKRIQRLEPCPVPMPAIERVEP